MRWKCKMKVSKYSENTFADKQSDFEFQERFKRKLKWQRSICFDVCTCEVCECEEAIISAAANQGEIGTDFCKRAVIETQLTCFNKKNIICTLSPTRGTLVLTAAHLWTPPQHITALLKFYRSSVKDGDLVHSKTPICSFQYEWPCKFGATGAAEMWNCEGHAEQPATQG